MSKIPVAVVGVICTLVLAVAIIGGGIAIDAGLIFQASSTTSSTGGEYECEIEDRDALRSAITGNTGWDEAQLDNAIVVYLTAAQRGLGDQGAIIGIITAYTESHLYTYANFNVEESLGYEHDKIGEDHDSVGVFQQRPSAGWGTVSQLMSTDYAAGKFYDKLVTIDGWQSMPPGEAAQAVQISAFPDRYADHVDMATTILDHFKTYVTCTPVGGDWVNPLPSGTFWGGYRTSDRPDHQGIDIGADKGAEILAASAGTVVTSKCDAELHGNEYSCDIDGSGEVLGCGWYVDIEHAGGFVTRYCHMVSQPLVAVGDTVSTGQLIGYVGSSGNSGAAHLHYETHVGGAPATKANSREPLAFMAERGVDLD
ncbi:M23 family metallopeptidase [Glycomyces sp. NPDC048151]|uniref:M23 family metallopeptidase n=1 Tax=Glycomyces sp. NPDC048151 TaxID=3364002 RepID=UPI0037154EB9